MTLLEQKHLSSNQTTPHEPRVSVVVPSYNHARFIKTALHSIIRQTLPPSELTVIDDGSTDGSPDIIERVLKECTFPCEFLSRPNRGLCATLNEGLSRCREEYFAYLGSDDLWLPNFLRSRIRALAARPRAVLGYGHAYLIDEHNQIVDCTKDWANYADGNAREMLLKTTAPMSPTVLYRRSALERHGWNENAHLEDYDLYLRLSVDGDFAFDPQVLSAWRRHEYNTSTDQSFMLHEQLKAQRNAAADLGIGGDALEKLQTAVRFNRAEDFLRMGQKSKALGLMFHNLKGATSPRSVARMMIRLCMPFSAIERRRKLLQLRATRRYGSIQL